MIKGPLRTKSKPISTQRLWTMKASICSVLFTRGRNRSCTANSGKIMTVPFLMASCTGHFEHTGSRLWSFKSTLDVENFVCRFYWSVCIDFGTICLRNVCCSLKSPKKLIKPLFWRSRSSKIIDFGANRKPVYDFLLVHCFWGMATYRPKIVIFFYPSYLAPLLGVIFLEFMEKLYGSWN